MPREEHNHPVFLAMWRWPDHFARHSWLQPIAILEHLCVASEDRGIPYMPAIAELLRWCLGRQRIQEASNRFGIVRELHSYTIVILAVLDGGSSNYHAALSIT